MTRFWKSSRNSNDVFEFLLAYWCKTRHLAVELLDAYTARGVLGARFRTDMLHIALATVADVDVLVSWNFRHIVRLDKIRLFNAVNLEQGYKPLSIYSPREVVSDDKND